MEYHIEYTSDKSHKPEKELFVEKSFNEKSSKRNKNILIVLSISAICLFAGSTVYFTRTGKENNNHFYGNSIDEHNNDDYIITSLLKSKGGKKFIVSKLEELIVTHLKNGELDSEKEQLINLKEKKGDDRRYNNAVVSESKKRVGNLKASRIINDINFFDTRFLMTNIETVNAFYLFMKKHGKKYKTSEEMQERFLAFSENLKKIERHNSNPNILYKTGLNQYSDLSFEELKKSILISKRDLRKILGDSPYMTSYDDAIKKYKSPNAIVENIHYDWRELNAVTPVKNQGMCGSCWAFAVVGSVESQYAIRRNQQVSISEQELVDCSAKNLGCYGGLAGYAFDDMIELGFFCAEEDYPYFGVQPLQCRTNQCKKKYTIKSYVQIPSDKFKEAIQFLGPLTVDIDADDDFAIYTEGIYNSDSNDETNHEVMLVGYGMEEIFNNQLNKNEKHYYYIIKNSWGTTWGEKGFMRIETDELGLKKTNNMSVAYVPLLD
ncbi:cysteine proteinase gondepain 4 [Plasmodium gonderi]|uniref:Cysteine proteinase gondepain 4 n=1 Tax=Plasmodium gonderi TaxID=77519 RepID=A0A1Y1JKH2_PLAGO|nr:cysteine proteinase gondepain 4 [Plasmodium gonderi]GAW80923.1 cysteine proteinase gondepain 4 [Plasmodium gonderi]